MELVLLGTGGWMPTDDRETACALVRDGDRALVVDAGTGFRRLITDRELLDGLGRLDIVLTHFHLDHTIGLLYLPALDVPVELWAAGRTLAGTSAAELMGRLLEPPFSGGDLERLFARIHELAPPRVEIGGFDVEMRVQSKHLAPTLALRVNDVLAYCTDTAYDEENVAFASGASVLVHEAFHAGDTTDDEWHTAAGEAARLAAAARVERLVLIHPDPTSKADPERLAAARRHFAATEIGRDGMRLELG